MINQPLHVLLLTCIQIKLKRWHQSSPITGQNSLWIMVGLWEGAGDDKNLPREKEIRWLEPAGLCRKSDFIGHGGSSFSHCSAVHNGLHTCYKCMLAHTQHTHNHMLLLDQFWENCGNTHLVIRLEKEWRKHRNRMLAWTEVWASSRVWDMNSLTNVFNLTIMTICQFHISQQQQQKKNASPKCGVVIATADLSCVWGRRQKALCVCVFPCCLLRAWATHHAKTAWIDKQETFSKWAQSKWIRPWCH